MVEGSVQAAHRGTPDREGPKPERIPAHRPAKPLSRGIFHNRNLPSLPYPVSRNAEEAGEFGVLTRLTISNLATIQSLTIDFHQGFSVLTGETGAGKSILIDAIHFVLGAKAARDLIRTGAEQAMVEAQFDLDSLPEVRQDLEELEIPIEDELVVRRTLQSSGRSRALVNDCSVSQRRLEALGAYLVNIHGQHDNQLLLNPDKHIDYLDAFGEMDPLRTQVEESHREYTGLLRERRELNAQVEQREARKADLAEQIGELKAANLLPGEEEKLRQEHTLLANSETLSQLVGSACDALYEGEQAILSRLAAIFPSLTQAAKIDENLKPLQELLPSAQFQLEDLYRSLNAYLARLEGDPNRLEWVNERLAAIERIKRRYGGSVEAATELLRDNEKELDVLGRTEIRLEELNQRIREVAKRLHGSAEELSARRKQAAERFDHLILEQLRELGMEKAAFQTAIEPLKNSDGTYPMYSPAGMDRVEFLLSTNPGQELRPFSRIASGGELSRTMLALKTILARTDPTRTLIFDEVDAGISGALAEMVGAKLRGLGHTHQVLCVTHLPQIAALGSHHVLVSKEVGQQETFTNVNHLSEEEKVREVARLLSGIDVSGHSVASAEEMVSRGKEPTT
jgi:DNA repair protein RecN (Recombination protein N)